MSRKKKLRDKLFNNPKNMTPKEVDTLMGLFGFSKSNRGKSTGSGVCYYDPTGNYNKFFMHYPHSPNGGKTVDTGAIKSLIDFFEENGL